MVFIRDPKDPRKALGAARNLPADDNLNPIQVLGPGPSVTVAIGTATANVALPTAATILRCANNVNMCAAFGDSNVTVSATNNMLVTSGAEVFLVPAGATHVAVIAADGVTIGEASFTEMQGIF